VSTRAYTLISSLLPRLQAISVANGYLTNAGASVQLGPIPHVDGEAVPFIRLNETDATTESAAPYAPHSKIRVQFTVEAYAEESTAANILATGHNLLADLKHAMFGDITRDLNGQAIDARLEGYSILPPESGSDFVVAQVRGSFSFVDHFNAP